MRVKAVMDVLLEAGWYVIRRGFDERKFKRWAQDAKECLNALFGPDNVYSLQFQRIINHPSRQSFFEGALLLGQIRESAATINKNDSNDAA